MARQLEPDMKLCAAFAALGVVICSAHAAGENAALKDTPVSRFTAEDYALMKQRVDEALQATKEGEKLEWRNDKTGASGSVIPMDRLTWNGMSCRRLQIVNVYGSTTGKGVYKFCQKTPGVWKIVGAG